MRHFLIIDIISSGMKTGIFSEDGCLAASAYRAHEVNFGDGTAEQDAELWKRSLLETTHEILEKTGQIDIAAVIFSAMSQVCLLVNSVGKPLYPALTWSDSRSSSLCKTYGDTHKRADIIRKFGVPDTPNMSIRKLAWFKEHKPELYEQTGAMIQCKDYLAFLLTGKIRTDHSDAATTCAYDLKTADWSDDVLNFYGIDRAKMPPIVHSDEIMGYVTDAAAAKYGIPEGTPVMIGAGDILCSAVGAGCTDPGDLYMSLGSSSWIAACKDIPAVDPNGLITTNPHAVPGRFLSFVNYQTAGVVFKWLKNEIFRYDPNGAREVLPFKNIYPYDEMESLITKSVPGSHGLLFLAHLLPGESTHPEASAAGSYIGLCWTHTREDMIRASLEGVCYELRVFAELLTDGKLPDVVTITGIASHETAWLQMLADVFGTTIRNTVLHETPDSIGACVLAGCSLGIYDSYSAVELYRSYESEFNPDPERHEIYDRYYEIYRHAFEGTKNTLEALHAIQ